MYERVPGGERNEKSGSNWTRQELEEVLGLYLSLHGRKIHENNPAIQKLAQKLGRTTRSVEAQLLVFRQIEGGKGYAHGSKICRELWWEFMNRGGSEKGTPKNEPSGSCDQRSSAEVLHKNDYVLKLLSYSAERDYAIGNPQQWNTPPPLMVNTPLTEEMREFAAEIWKVPPRPVWYFLVGGPGNGKSEAVGAFVRHLNMAAEQEGHPAPFLAKDGKDGGRIPYWFESSINDVKVILLQDISVPQKQGSRPEVDFLTILDRALNSRSHIIVCGNRGMLLRASKQASVDPKYKHFDKLIRDIDLRSAEDSAPDTSREPFSIGDREVDLRVWPLDHESVLFGSGGDNPWRNPMNSILDQAIKIAIDQVNWEQNGCDGCLACELCPMLADVIWLRDDKRRQSFLKLLRHAEVLSGQRLVLREALATLSLVLVGCPADFSPKHPCEWVQERIDKDDVVKTADFLCLLELLSHRIYQDLYGRHSPTGLNLEAGRKSSDGWVLSELQKLGAKGNNIAKTVKIVGRRAAKHAGPLRIVGELGILNQLDPSKDIAWCRRRELEIDVTLGEMREKCIVHRHPLEDEIADYFEEIENYTLAQEPHHDNAKIMAAIYRWASTLYLRHVGTALGEWVHAPLLDNYLGLLQSFSGHIQTSGGAVTLRDLVEKAAGSNKDIFELAPSFYTELPSPNLSFRHGRNRSESPRWPANDRLIIRVSPVQGKHEITAILSARTFLDMWQKVAMHIAEWSMPEALESLMSTWIADYVVSNGVFLRTPVVSSRSKARSMKFEFYEDGIQVSRM